MPAVSFLDKTPPIKMFWHPVRFEKNFSHGTLAQFGYSDLCQLNQCCKAARPRKRGFRCGRVLCLSSPVVVPVPQPGLPSPAPFCSSPPLLPSYAPPCLHSILLTSCPICPIPLEKALAPCNEAPCIFAGRESSNPVSGCLA